MPNSVIRTKTIFLFGAYPEYLQKKVIKEMRRRKYTVKQPKTLDGLELVYLPNTGGEIGIKMGNDGYTDIFGLRKTTRINFTEFDNGNFYETVSGGLRIDYTVKFDESKRPVSITDDSGNTMEIYW